MIIRTNHKKNDDTHAKINKNHDDNKTIHHNNGINQSNRTDDKTTYE